jgi:membrane-associated phospholipid phosphatase
METTPRQHAAGRNNLYKSAREGLARATDLGFRRPFLGVAAISATAVALLAILVSVSPFLPIDGSIERAVQNVDLNALAPVFQFYAMIGGPGAIFSGAIVVAVILLLNPKAWKFLGAGAMASGWYFMLSSLIIRPRPWVPEVLRVTEHPGASSFPSGHMVLYVFFGVAVAIGLGYRFLPRSLTPIAWTFAVVFVGFGAISRMYSGAHWPSDVLAGLLIGIGWMSLVLAVRWISDPLIARHSQRR